MGDWQVKWFGIRYLAWVLLVSGLRISVFVRTNEMIACKRQAVGLLTPISMSGQWHKKLFSVPGHTAKQV